jgi:flagellar protein FlaG
MTMVNMSLDRLEVGARVAQAVRPAPAPFPAPAPAPAVAAAPAAQGGAAASGDGSAGAEFLEAARELRQAIGVARQTDLRFNVDQDTHQVQFEIIDRSTGQVVRQVPHETLVRFAEAFDAYLGMILDKEV